MPIRPRDPKSPIRRRIIRKPNDGVPSTPAQMPPTLPADAPPIVARPRVRLLTPQALSSAITAAPAVAPAPRPKRAHHKVDRTGPNWTEDGNYIVGRGKPPKHGQWKTGQSGNPAGPRKQVKLTPQEAFDEQLLAEFTTRVNGKEVLMNNGIFGINLLKQSAAKGVVRAQIELYRIYRERLNAKISPEVAEELSDREEEAIDAFLLDLALPKHPVVRKPRIDPERSDDGGEERQ